jgi:hypothetical protein
MICSLVCAQADSIICFPRSDLSQIHLRLDEFSNLHRNQMHKLSVRGRYLEGLREQVSKPLLINDIPNSINTPGQVLSNVTQAGDRLLNESIETICHTKIARHLCIDQYSSLPQINGRPMSYSAVRIRASHFRRSRCEGWCSCICHRPQYLRTPPSGDPLLGSLFMSCSGFSIRLQPCNQRNCNKPVYPYRHCQLSVPAMASGKDDSLCDIIHIF